MVIDTSAIVAIMLSEPEGGAFARAIRAASVRLISAATVAEAGIVLSRRAGEAGRDQPRAFLAAAGCDVVPVTAAHAWLAVDAYRRYGKGNHPARLNFGDCFSYALAKASGHPLLFKGDDFARTDVVSALPAP